MGKGDKTESIAAENRDERNTCDETRPRHAAKGSKKNKAKDDGAAARFDLMRQCLTEMRDLRVRMEAILLIAESEHRHN